SATGVYETASEKLSRLFNFKYGQARAWGSVGYAISALVAGHLFVIDPEHNFRLGSLIALVLLLIIIFWRSKSEKVTIRNLRGDPVDHAISSARDFMWTLRMQHLWIVMLFIMFTATFHGNDDVKTFPDLYTKLFDDPKPGQTMESNLYAIQ